MKPQDSTSPRQRRNWFQFRLRTTLIAMTGCGVLFFLWVQVIQVRRDHLQVISLAEELGGSYTTQWRGPAWLAPIAGNWNVFQRVTRLDLSRTKVRDEDLAILTKVPELRSLNLSNTQITGAGLEYITPLRRLRDLRLHRTKVEWDSATSAVVKKRLSLYTLNDVTKRQKLYVGSKSPGLFHLGKQRVYVNPGDTFVGRGDNGTLRITDGAVFVAKDLTTLSRGPGSQADVLVTGGGLWDLKSFGEFGECGVANVRVEADSKILCDRWIRLASYSTSSATLELSGQNAFCYCEFLDIARSGRATLKVSNGARCTTRDWLRFASGASSTATIRADGQGSILKVASWLKSEKGTAKLEVLDGARVEVGKNIRLAEMPGSSAQVLVRGRDSTLTVDGPIRMGAKSGQSSARMTVDQGAVVQASKSMMLAADAILNVQDDSRVALQGSLQVLRGHVRLHDNATLSAVQVQVMRDSSLAGQGGIEGALVNEGSLHLGREECIHVSQDLVLAVTSQLWVKLPRKGDATPLRIDGAARLAGVLHLHGQIDMQDAVTILTAKTLEGRFDRVVGPEDGKRFSGRVEYTSGAVVLHRVQSENASNP